MGDMVPLSWDHEAFLMTCCIKHPSNWICQQFHNDFLETITPFILSFSPDVRQPGWEYWRRRLECLVAICSSTFLPTWALFASCSLPVPTLFALYVAQYLPPALPALYLVSYWLWWSFYMLWGCGVHHSCLWWRKSWFGQHMWNFCKNAAKRITAVSQRANSVSSYVVTERLYCSFSQLSVNMPTSFWFFPRRYSLSYPTFFLRCETTRLSTQCCSCATPSSQTWQASAQFLGLYLLLALPLSSLPSSLFIFLGTSFPSFFLVMFSES